MLEGTASGTVVGKLAGEILKVSITFFNNKSDIRRLFFFKIGLRYVNVYQ